MRSNEPPSLPNWIEQAYEILAVEITEGSTEGLSRERAYEVLLAHEHFPDNSPDAEYAIDRLLNSGWIYEVNDHLRITDTERL
jgi:hypothetical protein